MSNTAKIPGGYVQIRFHQLQALCNQTIKEVEKFETATFSNCIDEVLDDVDRYLAAYKKLGFFKRCKEFKAYELYKGIKTREDACRYLESWPKDLQIWKSSNSIKALATKLHAMNISYLHSDVESDPIIMLSLEVYTTLTDFKVKI